jgi:Arc/MetJ family transcription regulator
MHVPRMLMHMRTTLNINDELLRQAARLSGITEKTAVVHAGLEALIARESAKRLAALGGSKPRLRRIRRRRPQVR